MLSTLYLLYRPSQKSTNKNIHFPPKSSEFIFEALQLISNSSTILPGKPYYFSSFLPSTIYMYHLQSTANRNRPIEIHQKPSLPIPQTISSSPYPPLPTSTSTSLYTSSTLPGAVGFPIVMKPQWLQIMHILVSSYFASPQITRIIFHFQPHLKQKPPIYLFLSLYPVTIGPAISCQITDFLAVG